uniref:Immunoglobulin domain-containing protein n=1 Tax=Cyprinus carpio TaxID=7962 RepID=A0A8C1S4M1_CYPCA
MMHKPLNFKLMYFLCILITILMVKSCSKSKLTNIGTSHGLKQVNGLNSLNDAKWRNIHLKDQTPDLVISNIQSDQTGVYKVEINTISKVVHRKYCIAVGDEMKIVSVKEGESVTLRTGAVDIQAFDLILWEYEDHPMAKIDRTLHQLPKNSVSSRFAGRLSQNENNGYLTISDSRSTDSGDYHLNMNNSAFTLQRTIRVTVKGE